MLLALLLVLRDPLGTRRPLTRVLPCSPAYHPSPQLYPIPRPSVAHTHSFGSKYAPQVALPFAPIFRPVLGTMANETTKRIYVRGYVRPEETPSRLRGWLYKALDAHASDLPENVKSAIVENVRADFCDWDAKQPWIQMPHPVKAMKTMKTKKKINYGLILH